MPKAKWTADIAFVSTFLFLFPAFSAQTLTWHQSLDETSKNNSELRSAHEKLNASRSTKKGSYSNYFPSIAGSLSYDYRKDPDLGVTKFLTDTGLGYTNPSKTYEASLTLNQNLFAGFHDQALVNQASAQVELAEANLSSVMAKVSFDLKSAYAGMLFAQRLIDLEGRIVARQKENVRLVELRFQGGRENSGSVLLSRANFNQARFNLMKASNNLEVAEADLARTLGWDDDSNFVVSDDIPVAIPPLHPEFRNLAADSADHQQVKAEESFAEAGLTLARSGFFPTLGLTGAKGRADDHFFPSRDTWSISTRLTIPLFDGGRDYYQSKSAGSTLVAAKSTRQNVDRELLTRLKQTFHTFTEAVEKVQVDRSFLEAAAKRSEIARGKYNNGLMTFEEWDLIENDLIARETSVLQSERDLIVNEASWQRAQGKGSIQ